MIICVTGQPHYFYPFQEAWRKMTEFYVKVKPDQNEFRIEEGRFPTVHLGSEAENGRANSELVNKLTEILGEKPGIISGHQSRRKKLKVDLPEEKVERKIEAEY
ncbi:hypothetical protein GKQ38_04490 [Candidatus Nanohaloarchaea archaeon]|nr:hypothetical protein GKQ38_04490 [Candidatus Nanohaloarchaea archaeon]